MANNITPVTSRDSDVVQLVASMPYADCRELSAAFGCSEQDMEGALGRLNTHRLMRFVWFEGAGRCWSQRWFVTAWGTLYLGWLGSGEAGDAVLAYPLSLSWQRRFLRRLEVVEAMYSVALAAGTAWRDGVRWRWRNGEPLYADMVVGGKAFRVIRLGRSVRVANALEVIRGMGWMQRNKDFPNVLVITPGAIALDRIVSDCREAQDASIYFADEEVLCTTGGQGEWHRFGRPPMGMHGVIDDAKQARDFPPASPFGSPDETMASEMPRHVLESEVFVSCDMSVSERRLLEFLNEWPYPDRRLVGAVLRMGKSELHSHLVALKDRGYVVEVANFGSYGNRLGLTDEGLERMALLDGVDGLELVRQKSFAEIHMGKVVRNRVGDVMAGSQMRQIARFIKHEVEMQRLLIAFCDGMAARSIVEFEDVLHGSRWSRVCGPKGALFTPRAILRVRQGDGAQHFFLEVADGARGGVVIQRRLERYESYLRSEEASVDFGGRKPAMLVAVEGHRTLETVLEVLARRYRYSMPVFVATFGAIKIESPFGRVWHNPWREKGDVLAFSQIAASYGDVPEAKFRDYGSLQVTGTGMSSDLGEGAGGIQRVMTSIPPG